VHPRAFAAVVLSGAYVEAGDTGRHRMQPGDVLLHQAYEGHLDRFDARGGEVLMLDLALESERFLVGRITDPDELVRLAERDPNEALAHLLANVTTHPQRPGDWPDLLARDLRADPTLNLAAWADAHGLHPGSVSRGFQQVFGLTPAAYRVAQRTVSAIRAIRGSTGPLSSLAHDCGFADQAHMSRSVRRLAGMTPGRLRSSRPAG
jgi:AraC-like DNA-binding protein